MQITQEYLKECLDYNPDTGVFTWKQRPLRHFKTNKAHKIWHKRFLGSIAGSIDGRGYLTISINKATYAAHRLAWLYANGVLPSYTDHINGDKLDNRIINIRSVTNQENLKNCSISKNNTSGVTGVTWHKSAGKWCAQIHPDNKCVYLGLHKDKFEAICARKSAEIKYGFHENHGRKVC